MSGRKVCFGALLQRIAQGYAPTGVACTGHSHPAGGEAVRKRTAPLPLGRTSAQGWPPPPPPLPRSPRLPPEPMFTMNVPFDARGPFGASSFATQTGPLRYSRRGAAQPIGCRC